MPEPRVLILRAAGTNCDAETAHAFATHGATTQVVHVNKLLATPTLLEKVGLVAIPGGFSYGDDIAAGKIFAAEISNTLGDHFRKFIARGGLLLGICNGFQVLVKTGLLTVPDEQGAASPITLHWNDTHRYEARWVYVSVDARLCVMAPKDRVQMQLPVAHGEGKLIGGDARMAKRAVDTHQAVFRYVNQDGTEPSWPANPNGSEGNIAGLCDATGQVLGLMPHPERAMFPWHHPSWTREPERREGDGACFFRAAVAAMR
ncbi:MAG: phosphoribosylformylglycinamidine synthase I [Planctomycetes bacterium]|nr:phosphoribosylformylglycinamidine synthase I [Planctomycetota bacterium]